MIYMVSVLHAPSYHSPTRYNPNYHLIRYPISSFFLLFPQETLHNAGFFVFPTKPGTMEPMNTCLRQAVLDDGPTVHSHLFAEEPWKQFYPRFFSWITRQEQNRLFYLLVKQDDNLVGQGQLHFSRRHQAEIANVCIAAAYRRQGFGTTIINQLIQEAQTRQCALIELCVTEENQAAQTLYQKLGFAVSRSLFTPHGELALVMSKALH